MASWSERIEVALSVVLVPASEAALRERRPLRSSSAREPCLWSSSMCARLITCRDTKRVAVG